MKRNAILYIFSAISSVLILAIDGCASSPDPRPAQIDLSKPVAAILAKSAAGHLAFKDHDGANEIAASISGSDRLKFALVLDPEFKIVGKYFAVKFDGNSAELIDAIQKKTPKNSEFSFDQNGLHVTVVPVGNGSDYWGYAAVGSL